MWLIWIPGGRLTWNRRNHFMSFELNGLSTPALARVFGFLLAICPNASRLTMGADRTTSGGCTRLHECQYPLQRHVLCAEVKMGIFCEFSRFKQSYGYLVRAPEVFCIKQPMTSSFSNSRGCNCTPLHPPRRRPCASLSTLAREWICSLLQMII